jgi:cobyrinic acid a,c-diamide synthase
VPTLGPRLVVAGTHSGVGKTTVATGLMAALRRHGLAVGAAKVGPDFIDPGYHALATGRPARNLDAWICGPEVIGPLAAQAREGCEMLVVEGVMGLFDGAALPGPESSTAHLAVLIDAPVVLVVDASSMSGSVAALVHGFATWRADVRIAGVVLNRVATDSHERQLRDALAPLDIPVLGVLRRDPVLSWRDRHLGLVPVAEQEATVRRSLDRLAETVGRSCDLEALVALARSAPPVTVAAPPAARPSGKVRIAVAGGDSFSFYYRDNLDLLAQAGAELVTFDPGVDARLPPGIGGLYAGGGFPEVFATHLAANEALRDDVRTKLRAGLVTWAECGGLLWLARTLDGHAMAGVIPAAARMTERLTLGYRRARLRTDSPLAGAGADLRGHEFHYSALDPAGDALDLEGRSGRERAGFATSTLLASYVHLHLAATPELAERFVATAAGTSDRLPV